MRTRFLFLFSVLFFGFVISSCSSNDEALTTFDGQQFNLMSKGVKGGVCMFIAPDCPLSQSYVQSFMDLSKQYEDDFQFFGVLPGTLFSNEEVQLFIDSFEFALPMVQDPNHHLTKKWKATVTPEFILFDTSSLALYSGAIDNWAISLAKKRLEPSQFYLEEAINAYLQHKPITTPRTRPVGCYIEGID